MERGLAAWESIVEVGELIDGVKKLNDRVGNASNVPADAVDEMHEASTKSFGGVMALFADYCCLRNPCQSP